MRIVTTCAACGLVLTYTGTNTHPGCPPTPPNPIHTAYTEALHTDNTTDITNLGRILDTPPPPPRLADAAHMYAATYGWPVFPLRPGLKVPATPRGFKDATTDPDQITRWWKNTPNANVGLPTGIRFDVIDIDAPNGYPSMWAMEDNGALPDIHGVSTTAGAGLHLLVEPLNGGGNLAGILPGVDVRGLGGYIVGPPSITTDGRPYTWRHYPSPVIRKATP